MSRRRRISTDISVDKKLNRVSDVAALLYTWMLPHADDTCRVVPTDPEEVMLQVIPGRKKSIEEVAAALDELMAAELIGQDERGHYFFPSDSFYKYNTEVPEKKRIQTPSLDRSETQKNCEITEKLCSTVKSQENTASPSPSSSLSPPPSPSMPALAALATRARAELVIDNDLGLGEKHPAKLCGWDRWNRLEHFWKLEGKKLGIFQVQCLFKQLDDILKSGHDPGEAVEKSIRCGWKDIYPPDKEPPQKIVNFDRVRELSVRK